MAYENGTDFIDYFPDFIIKIFRYDNNFLELEMSKREVESLINYLSDLLKEE